MKRSLARVVAQQVERARYVFEVSGFVTPKLWVADPRLSCVAEPIVKSGNEATDYQRAQLLCAMQSEHGGSVIGRTDEVWVRFGDDLPTLSGGLAENVDTDPSICTGLLVVALDTKHAQVAAIVTRQALLDDGSTEWRIASVPKEHVDRLASILVLADTLHCEPTSVAHAEEMGWHVAWV